MRWRLAAALLGAVVAVGLWALWARGVDSESAPAAPAWTPAAALPLTAQGLVPDDTDPGPPSELPQEVEDPDPATGRGLVPPDTDPKPLVNFAEVDDPDPATGRGEVPPDTDPDPPR